MRPFLRIPPLALLAACAPTAPGTEAALPSPSARAIEATADERAAHERMLERLADIARKVDDENPYLGSFPVRLLEQELAKPQTNPAQEAELRFQLSQNLLRVGRTDEALAALKAARELALALPEGARPEWTPRLPFELGVACMRLAENRNCIARHTQESCVFPVRGSGVHVDRAGSEQAIGWFRQALRTSKPGEPAHTSALWLLNIAHMTLGTWPDALEPAERIPPERLAAQLPFPRFQDLAGATKISGFNLAGGAACEDYDGDGRLDLLLSDWDPRSQLHFLHNDGTGTFADRTAGSGLEGIGGALNIVQADFDSDGRVDLFMPRGAWWNELGQHPRSLLRNLGGGHWVDVAYRAGVAEPGYPTQVGAFADYDLDGDLDLYVANESSERIKAPGQLFQNRGDGTFRDVAAEAGVTNDKYGKGAVFGDYDGDRYPDLYVSNLGARNKLYRNLGDGRFENVAQELKVEKPLDSFAAWFFDYDDDGALDLFVTGYYQSPLYRLAPVAASYLELPHAGEAAALYHNDGRGGFDNVARSAGLARVTLPMGCNFGELDNDGFPDFYLGTGYPGYDGLMPNVMFWNQGGRSFADVSEAGGFGNLQKGHGVLFADLDNDGDEDVVEQMGGAYPGDGFRNLLFANPGFGRHWLRVSVIGAGSNPIGVRLRAQITENGAARSVYRHVSSGGSFGANPLTQHLGLGTAARIEALEVFWPRTGKTQVFRDLPVDVHVSVREDRDGYELVPEVAFALATTGED